MGIINLFNFLRNHNTAFRKRFLNVDFTDIFMCVLPHIFIINMAVVMQNVLVILLCA